MTINTFTLNTATGVKDTTTGKYKTVSFDIPNTVIEDGAKLRITSIIHNGLAINTIIRIKNIYYNNSYNFNNDGAYPIIFTGNLGNFNNSIFLDNVLILNKQSLNFIDLHFSDDIEDINSGVLEGVNYLITIQIEQN